MTPFQPPVPPKVVAPAWHHPTYPPLTLEQLQAMRERLRFAVHDMGTVGPQQDIDQLLHAAERLVQIEALREKLSRQWAYPDQFQHALATLLALLPVRGAGEEG